MKELERAGIPSAHVCSITSVAQTLGSNRIVPAPRVGIPMGDRDLDPRAEKALRRAIVERALEALQTEVGEQRLFPVDA
ncbi:MAG: glycine/betaine/sarcosine/D-proline family reductase selenoprotein B [Chloroflexi bacterium]|nr:glycine/betaine/sarcosine/D-proline family reductase selenoprotein B [Chloroflexota bacterium]